MLESLYIKNYRNLKELKINSLAGVNLITGRNNTGKSSLLEAIAIYAPNKDTPNPSKNNIQFVRSWNINTTLNGTLFDCITLTDKEKYVVEALRIIEPDTDKIAFIADNTGERKTVVKLSSIAEVLPLQSMGDGINRILTIILALVNADNGFLLIDEFENGLHYTVQEQLWKMIFNLAQRLNTQVFVTTHSNDCIKGFENILNSSDNSYNGKLIRLDNKNGIIKQIEFNAEELQIANNQNIEIR